MRYVLVPNVRVPAKFKVLEFEKYKGNTYPETHLVMYYRKVVAYTDDDKLLIHYFQDSLFGAPLRWYMSLEHANIQNFLDLSQAFVQHYNDNMNMAPDRTQLGNCPKKSTNHLKNTYKGGEKLLPKSLHLLKRRNRANYS